MHISFIFLYSVVFMKNEGVPMKFYYLYVLNVNVKMERRLYL